MNEKNLTYLKEQVKYLGFGEGLQDALQKNIVEGKETFTLLLVTQINRNPFSAMLHFRRPESSDVYYLNKWDATLKNEAGTWAQTFYLGKGHGITLKEGYNLLEGRAVHKELTNSEGEKYRAWLQLDRSVDTSGQYKLQHFHQNYGYDLEKVLSALPIKELQDAGQKEALLKSLGKGNLQAVSFEKNGFIEKLFIAAAPRFKSIDTYDHNGNYISLKDLERRFDFVQKAGKCKEVSVLGKDAGKEDDPLKEGQENGVTRKAVNNKSVSSDSEGLLPKKRSTPRQGLHP